MKSELEAKISMLKERIQQDQLTLAKLEKEYLEVIKQEKAREEYMASSDIVDIIKKYTGNESNMSTIKRWADQGFLGEVIDERQRFWALKSKQGKKRFLYPKHNVYHFLYEKGYIKPLYHVLDRVKINQNNNQIQNEYAIIIKNELITDSFCYTIQLESNFQLFEKINENDLVLADDEKK